MSYLSKQQHYHCLHRNVYICICNRGTYNVCVVLNLVANMAFALFSNSIDVIVERNMHVYLYDYSGGR